MRNEPINLDGLYEVSKNLIAALPEMFLKADPHEDNDPTGSDQLWFRVRDDETEVEGEVIALCPGHPGTWYISHDAIYHVGGSPTFWSDTLNEDQIIEAVTAYLASQNL